MAVHRSFNSRIGSAAAHIFDRRVEKRVHTSVNAVRMSAYAT